MENPQHNHGDLITALEGVIRGQWPMTPQRFFQWKRRGIPYAYRAEIARIAGLHGVRVPDGFLDAPAQKDHAA